MAIATGILRCICVVSRLTKEYRDLLKAKEKREADATPEKETDAILLLPKVHIFSLLIARLCQDHSLPFGSVDSD